MKKFQTFLVNSFKTRNRRKITQDLRNGVRDLLNLLKCISLSSFGEHPANT